MQEKLICADPNIQCVHRQWYEILFFSLWHVKTKKKNKKKLGGMKFDFSDLKSNKWKIGIQNLSIGAPTWTMKVFFSKDALSIS